jgi:hypothetical protein
MTHDAMGSSALYSLRCSARACIAITLLALLAAAATPAHADLPNYPYSILDDFPVSFDRRMQCTDQTVCNDFDHCTDREAALKAGHLCHGFPYYNGGYPLKSLDWKDDHEDYTCLQTVKTNTSTYCVEWSAMEQGKSEAEAGKCTCTSRSETYCHTWRCEQREEEVCEYTREQGDQCCRWVSDDEGPDYYVCRTLEIEREVTQCECTRVNAMSGRFCSHWSCVETDINGAEYEWYTCQEADPTRSFCQSWTGLTNSSEEFERSKMQCLTSAGTYCAHWTGWERGLNYKVPATGYTALSILLGMWGLIPVFMGVYRLFGHTVGNLSKCESIALIYFGLVWINGFLILGIFLAGFVCFLFTLGVYAVVAIVVELSVCIGMGASRSCCGGCYGCCARRMRRNAKPQRAPVSVLPCRLEGESDMEMQQRQRAI